MLADKYGGVFSEIDKSIKGGDIDGANYDIFLKKFADVMGTRPTYRPTEILNGNNAVKSQESKVQQVQPQVLPEVSSNQKVTSNIGILPQKPSLLEQTMPSQKSVVEQRIPVEQPKGVTPFEQNIPPKIAKDNVDRIINDYKFSKRDELYTKLIDRFHPLSKLAKGADMDEEMRASLTHYYGAGSTADYYLNFELKPILENHNIDDLKSVAIAKHDIELRKYSIQGSPNQEGAENVLKTVQSKLGDAKMRELEDDIQKLYEYQDRILKENLVDTGIISKKAFASMKKKYKYYVPFKRIQDEVDDFLGMTPPTKGAGSISSQNVVYKMKGSNRELIDPVESIIENTYNAISAGTRQRVAKTIVDLRDSLPDGMIRKVEGKIGTKNTISLFENGKKVNYEVPPEISN